MAAATDRTNADSPQNLPIGAPPAPKDMQGSDNPIPLSPQWLLPKPGESKLGISTGEPHSTPHHAKNPDAVRAFGNGEDPHDTEKKRDVFRPSLYDSETGRRDRWRDEERETNSATRRDRWRETERELGDARKTERWLENTTRNSGEARRAPSERWADSAGRENNHDQRRENKWNNRWGPDDKESERREKWSDSGRDFEGSRERGPSNLTIHGKDMTGQVKDADKEGEQYSRAWRSNSSLARGRGDTSHHQPLAPNKQAHMFGSGRGKGENGPSVFSAGRGRVNSNTSSVNNGPSRSYPLGFVPERSEGVHGDPSILRYSRMKLLDVYRMNDVKSLRMSLEGFIEVPSLTIGEPLEPLALSAPTSEELVTLKGIEKGDIVSSGVPQVSKDGSTGKNSTDSSTSKQSRLGGREDSTYSDCKDESIDKMKGDQPSYLESPSYEKYSHPHGYDTNMSSSQTFHPYQENKFIPEAVRSDATIKIADDIGTKEVSMLGRTSSHNSIPWRSPSLGERSHESSRDFQDFSTQARARTSEMGWLHSQKVLDTDQRDGLVSSSYFRDESQWKNNDLHSELRRDSMIQKQSSEVLDQGKDGTVSNVHGDPFISRDKLSAGKFPPYQSPEELTLFYKDPHGRIQGPFSGSDLIGWFEAGYFGIDLQVRVAGAPADAPFSLLGDVMPHLRAKAIPPPGFGVAKPNDIMEVSNRGNFNSLGNAHSGVGELAAVQNAQRNRHEAATDAENRFIESLMSGNMSKSSSGHYSLPEVMQGYGGPTVGGESMKDMNYLLAQRVSLERQRSIPTSVPTSLPYWTGRDTSSMVSKSDIIPESPSPQSKFLPPVGEVPRQVPQQVDFLSLLQAAADKSPSPAVNSALPAWSSFPELRPLNNLVHGGMDIIKDRIDLQQNQHINSQTGFGAQQQRLHQQNQPSLTQILTQPGDLSSGVVPPEKLLASEISQDPQMLNLLQQQYLMSQIQLQSQTPLPTQLSLLDKYLLLKQQQQKQEQQQQQLLLQQQHLLSQVLSGHQSPQHFGEPSFGHLKASVPAGNASVDHLGLRQLYETLQNNQQVPVLTSLDGRSPTTPTPNLHAPLDVSYTVSRVPTPPQLPNEMFDHNIQPKELDPNLHQESKCHSNFVPKADLPISDTSFLSETMQNNAQEVFLEQKSMAELDNTGKQNNQSDISYASTGENMASFSSDSIDDPVSVEGTQTADMISSVSNQVDDMKISSNSIPEASVAESVKDVEMREVKKPSEKKSKKQKNPKAKPVSDLGKGSSKITDNQQQLKPDFETEKANIGGRKGIEESTYSGSLKTGAAHSVASAEPLDSPPAPVMSSTNISDHEAGILEKKAEHGDVGMLSMNSQTTSSHRGWKPAPGLKPKSLVEIQLEEQHRLQREATVPDSSAPVILPSLPAPWVGLVANSDNQPGKDFAQSSSSTQIVSGSAEYPSISSKNRKSQLHDLLAEEVLAKSKEEHAAFLDEKLSSLQSLPEASVQADVSSVVDDFVEAKDTKKSRRKGAKAKAAGLKASPPAASVHLSTPPVSTERSKSTNQVQQAKELLPLPPAGPSLGDFVFWKGDQTNSSPAPAWSSDSAKIKKATSLREIQKEQEKRNPSVQQQIPIPTPAKVQSNQVNRGSGSSWPVPGSSPSKAASPSQTKVGSHASSQSKSRTEDDLFWGPLDQAKAKQSDFPFLANPSGGGGKGTPVKGSPGNSLARQKSSGGRASEHNISTSPVTTHSFSKGKKDAGSKHSEAMDFRDWCEDELVKLTGSDDTSFLEFCMKQSASEAEMLLRENLGSMDRNHEFIDKFLNYKDFLAPDVIEMAFRAQSSRKKSNGDSLGSSKSGIIMERDADGGGGKKKGKKGKKVSPLVLGFNVVSNRIMMGEIQSVED
ncbi:uncharacterized protein M6B38_367660 [Iris pallida]|uniref:GYF domain-containing protein n=1 Tax=Iris pallida TaxID=29817 RepID=A0AAX6GFM6_IRIPA|nr:uncharacterized protein M6B38_367660 [Iris pallida]